MASMTKYQTFVVSKLCYAFKQMNVPHELDKTKTFAEFPHKGS